MEKQTTSAHGKFAQLQQSVTEEVIRLLEEGTVPWHQPWKFGIPKNHCSNRPYEGMNALVLNMAIERKNYRSGNFMTYKQAAQLGGHVKPGEKGHQVVFWKIGKKAIGTNANESTGEETDVFQKTFFPFVWNVFNLDQIDGIEAPINTTPDVSPITSCEAVYPNMADGPKLLLRGASAFYSPAIDAIQIPAMERFESAESYYATFFHELVHSTGHRSRLDRFERDGASHFGSESYSKEELIAEMGSAFLCAHTGIGISTMQASASYIQNWLHALANDRTLVYSASSKAFRAFSYILGN